MLLSSVKISLMSFTGKQKKYLKKNLKRFPLAKIATHLGVSEKEILNFLKSHWRKEKYQKFITKEKDTPKMSGRQTTRFSLKKWFKQNWKMLTFLTILVLGVYINSLGNDFLSDDIAAIKDNPEIHKISYFWKAPYFKSSPSLLIIFLTNKFFGFKPAFYRLPNILFHLGSVWTIYLLITLFFRSPIPLFTASIFAVHPILTEAVTWISGSPYSNSAFFILLSFLLYLLSPYYLTSLFSFYASLVFSEKVFVFPIALSLYEFCLGNLKNNWRKLIPFWLLGGFWAFYLLGSVGTRITSLETNFYQRPTITNPLIQVPIAITSYLKLIFWPKNLTLYHSEMMFTQLEYFLRLGGTILFLAAIFYFIKKDRRISFWLSFLIITLLPTLTPLSIAWVVAERYVYLGSLGIFVFVAWLIAKAGQLAKNKKVSWIILAVVLISLSIRTIVRNTDWKNQDTLWLATAKTSPSSAQNHNNLGDYYARHGNHEKAIEEFKIAIELQPNYGDAFHNLANVYHQIKKDDLAIENYQKALSFNPNLWQSHQNLAAIYFEHQDYQSAEQHLLKAVEINPDNPILYLNLGVVYLKLQDIPKAKQALQQVLRLDPQNEKAKQILMNLP